MRPQGYGILIFDAEQQRRIWAPAIDAATPTTMPAAISRLASRSTIRKTPPLTRNQPSNSKNALERGCTGFGDGVVLIARAAAHADGTHNLAATLQRDATGEDHDLAVVRGMDAEKLSARLRVGGEIFGSDVESPRGV